MKEGKDSWSLALRCDELAPGEMSAVQVEGRRLLIIRGHDGTYRALRATCPHQGADLARGLLTGATTAAGPGERFRVERVGEILRCPWHGFEFDVTTGLCPTDSRLRVRTYETLTEGDHVWVLL